MSPESDPEYQYQIKHYLWKNFNIDTRSLNFQSDQEAYEYACDVAYKTQERRGRKNMEREQQLREQLLEEQLLQTRPMELSWLGAGCLVDISSGESFHIKQLGGAFTGGSPRIADFLAKSKRLDEDIVDFVRRRFLSER